MDKKNEKKVMQEGEVISMQEAIKLLGTTRSTFYRWLRGGKIKSMKAGRQWRFYKQDIDRFLRGKDPIVDLPVDIKPFIGELEDKLRKAGGSKYSQGEQEDIPYFVNLLIHLACRMRASDIHVLPIIPEEGKDVAAVIKFRIDGVLHTITSADLRLLAPVVEQWKRMAGCNIHETVKPQDGRILMNVEGKDLDLRNSFLPSLMGESVTARVLSKDVVSTLKSVEKIGYSTSDREKILKSLKAPWGSIIITGPIASGKSTSLYSMLNYVINPGKKVMTVESPVEFMIPGAVQIAEREDAGMKIPVILRSILRQDPDIIMIGELREFATLQLIQQAALTGHLVLFCLHTEDAAGALTRMMKMGGEPFIIAESTRLIIAQRLVRELCSGCSVAEKPDSGELARAEEIMLRNGMKMSDLPHNFRKAVGCDACGGTGYRGRMVIAETLEISPEIAGALEKGASAEQLREVAIRQGMTTIAADGVKKAALGKTTLKEVFRVLALK